MASIHQQADDYAEAMVQDYIDDAWMRGVSISDEDAKEYRAMRYNKKFFSLGGKDENQN